MSESFEERPLMRSCLTCLPHERSLRLSSWQASGVPTGGSYPPSGDPVYDDRRSAVALPAYRATQVATRA